MACPPPHPTHPALLRYQPTVANFQAQVGSYGDITLGVNAVAVGGPAPFLKVLGLLGLQSLTNQSEIDYYASLAYISNTYAYINSLRSPAAAPYWDVAIPAYGSNISGPLYLQAFTDRGYNATVGASFLRASLWSFAHPNVVVDPQIMSAVRILVAQAGANASQVGCAGGGECQPGG